MMEDQQPAAACPNTDKDSDSIEEAEQPAVACPRKPEPQPEPQPGPQPEPQTEEESSDWDEEVHVMRSRRRGCDIEVVLRIARRRVG